MNITHEGTEIILLDIIVCVYIYFVLNKYYYIIMVAPMLATYFMS